MIVRTKIVVNNIESIEKNQAIGKKLYKENDVADGFSFELDDVNGVMPAEDKKNCIIFLQGIDLVIDEPYEEFKKLWELRKEIVKRK